MSDLALFDTPEPYRADPPVRRVPVRAHERRVTALAAPPVARKTDPQTSHDAGAQPGKARQRWMVLDAFARHGAATDYRVGQLLGIGRSSAGKRRLELERQGLVERTGVRKPTDGSTAEESRITDQGREVHARGSW